MGDLQALVAAARAGVTEVFKPPPVRHEDEVLQWHPLLLATAARAAMGARLLDAMYASHAPLLQGRCITVACPALADGMGDVVLAWRVCAALLQHAPEVNITLMVPDPAAAAPLGEGVGPLHLVGAGALDLAKRCDLLLITPSLRAARYLSAAMQGWLDEAMRRYPAMVVTEYGSGAASSQQVPTLATGFGPLVDGVFFDSALASVAAAHRAALPDARRAAMQAWVATALPALAGPWQRLHLMYVREPATLRHAVMRGLHASKGPPDATLMLVLRHAPSATEVAAWRDAGLNVTLRPRSDTGGALGPAGALGATGAGASVVPIAALPVAHFRECLLHADFAAVTGDQSLVEAVAARVCFAYEARTHKQTLAHRLQEIASRFGPEAHRAMSPLGAELPALLPAAGVWQAMCHHMCMAYDATSRLAGRAARTMWATDARRAQEALVIEACEPASSANDVQLVQRLLALQTLLPMQ